MCMLTDLVRYLLLCISAQTYNSQLIRGYFESDTVSTIYIYRCCAGLIWYILFTNITIHANTYTFIQRMKMLLTSVLSLSENILTMTSTHLKLIFQHLHYTLFLKHAGTYPAHFWIHAFRCSNKIFLKFIWSHSTSVKIFLFCFTERCQLFQKELTYLCSLFCPTCSGKPEVINYFRTKCSGGVW